MYTTNITLGNGAYGYLSLKDRTAPELLKAFQVM
jgi:hypothetical protein